MSELLGFVDKVATSEATTILVQGESGTGKDLIAKAIHYQSRRQEKPFVAINCSAIPETLMEAELFGHERGAFTDAKAMKKGLFEMADGGTLFLDEIGDMPIALQGKILRLLQEQTFERVGGSETIHTDVRVLAATHRDLKAWSEEGKFRPDLYYRLGVFTIHLPPLRERHGDLPILVQYCLRRYSQELGREVREVTPETLELLQKYSWPGNIRELQSVLKQALLQASGNTLLPTFLPEFTGSPNESGPAALGANPDLEAFIRERLGPDSQELYADTHRHVDRLLLALVMEHTGGSQHQAARMLGIARQTLRQKLRDLGMHVMHSVEAEQENLS
jgi:two-component system nitrogen regulation response regulator GlnG